MRNIMIMTGSVRKERAADGVLAAVKAELEKRDNVNVQVADIATYQLPLIDTPVLPSDENFTDSHDSVKQWRHAVNDVDAVIMLTPEYNAGLSPAQKNAIDWLHPEWKDKPVAAIGYSWHGADTAYRHLGDVLARLGARQIEPVTSLAFMKNVALSGEPLAEGDALEQINATIDGVLGSLNNN